jgi:predicted nucleic acid-binding protein
MWSGAYTEMNSSPADVVCDAGPLIHLDELDCLDLLSDFQTVFVPEQVWREVENHRPNALKHPDVVMQRVSIELSENAPFQTLVRALALDLGEQAALSLMERYPQATLLTDDAAARLAAESLGYEAHGSIGILLRAIRRRQRTLQQVLLTLRSLPTRSSLHIRPDLLQRIITRVETELDN